MKALALAVSAGFAVAATPAFAAFTTLPTSVPVRVSGSANLNADQLFIAPGAFDSLTGVYALPSNFTLLAELESEFELPNEDFDPLDPLSEEFEEVGEFEDLVLLDTNDGKLVFASRIEMDPLEEGEINDIFRRGFEGFSVAVAWTFATDFDLRLYDAGRTDDSTIEPDNDFDPDVVGLGTDVNVEEGNATTGWYFIKVLDNNVGYAIFQNAVGLGQAGEEDQAPYTAFISGFAPVAVPVPAAVWLLGSALAGMAGVARRRA